MHKITSFRASKNTNSVFSATKQIMRMRGPDAQKLFLSEKKLLNAILRASSWKMFLSNEMNSFFAMQKTICIANHENARPTDAQKLLLSEKKLLNAILRAKLKYMKNVSF